MSFLSDTPTVIIQRDRKDTAVIRSEPALPRDRLNALRKQILNGNLKLRKAPRAAIPKLVANW